MKDINRVVSVRCLSGSFLGMNLAVTQLSVESGYIGFD